MTDLNVLRKDQKNSSDVVSIFPVNDHKYIALDTTGAGRIIGIRLMDEWTGGDCCVARYEIIPFRIIYMCDVACEISDLDENYFVLDLDTLSYMEDCFQEVC